MLKKMEWEENNGLGATGQGRRDPVPTQLKLDRKGLGANGNLPYKITHFRANEIPDSLKLEEKPKKIRMTKYKRKIKEKLEKNQEKAIRNFVFN